MPLLTRHVARAVALSLALLVTGVTSIAAAEVRVDVQTDKKKLRVDDQLTLTITVQSEGAGSPDVELPDLAGFEILRRQVQRPMQFSFNFGRRAMVQSSSVYTFVLRPTQVGTLEIGSVKVTLDGEHYTTEPVRIEVSDAPGGAPASPGGQAPDDDADNLQVPAQGEAATANSAGTVDGAEVDPVAFIRTIADKARPYVGEQVTVTVYLYLRERLQSAPVVEQEVTMDGFWTRDLLPAGHTLQPRRQVIRGRAYAVYMLRRFAAFPLKPGELTIGAMSLRIDRSSMLDLFAGGRTQPDLERTGVPLLIDVQPLPEQGRPKGPVAVGDYSIEAALDRTQTATGDAVTLTATVQGRGNVETVSLETPQIDGLDVLQPQVKELVETPNDIVSGTREYRWLIVPRTPGHYTIAPITLNTFDPETQRYRAVKSSELSLQVVGRALDAAQAPSQPGAGESAQAEEPDETDTTHWPPVRTESALARSHSLIAEQPYYGWLLALPPLFWLAAVVLGSARRRAAARVVTPEQRAAREAEQRLRAAREAARSGDAGGYHGAAARAIECQLEARLGESVASLTRNQLRALLVERGMDDALARQLVETLERADFARFASQGESQGELSQLSTQLAALIERLRGFSPRSEAA